MTEDSPDFDLAPLTVALSKLTEDLAQKIVQDRLPGLLAQAVAAETVLITETVQETVRRALPDLLKPMVEKMAKDIIEQVARELVPEQAEAAVQKEIERLTVEV